MSASDLDELLSKLDALCVRGDVHATAEAAQLVARTVLGDKLKSATTIIHAEGRCGLASTIESPTTIARVLRAAADVLERKVQ